MLKPNDFDIWNLRIKQYMLLTNYTMWDVVENGPKGTKTIEADGTIKKRPPLSNDLERKAGQSEMKALSTLLLGIPN